MLLELTNRVLNGCLIAQLRGEADVCSASALDRHLSAVLAEQAPVVVLDLSGLKFLDCAALRVVLAAERKTASYGGRLLLAAPQPIVARLLQLTALDQHFTIYPTAAKAAIASQAEQVQDAESESIARDNACGTSSVERPPTKNRDRL